jgi:hypothetical protein
MTTEHSQETKIAILEAKVEHMMGHVKELTQRVRANEKVVASVSLLGVIACTIIGAGYFAPKAEACSPRLDGEPTYCPDWDDVVLRDPPSAPVEEEEEPRYINDWEQGKVVFYDTREDTPLVIMDTYNHMVDKLRNWKAEQERTPVEDSINNALAELEWNEYGSNETPKQEELLQLPSDGD